VTVAKEVLSEDLWKIIQTHLPEPKQEGSCVQAGEEYKTGRL
jgi:hypothetical protein